MAPEAYKLEEGDMQPERFHPKKTDVYSLGLICFCVLVGEPTPFPPTELMNPTVKAFKGSVRNRKRPQLPRNCPNCFWTCFMNLSNLKAWTTISLSN
jgi:hypothetical protein